MNAPPSHSPPPALLPHSAGSPDRLELRRFAGAARRGHFGRAAPIEQPMPCTTQAIAFGQTTTEPLRRGFLGALRDVVMALATDGTWKGARIVRPETADSTTPSASDPEAWQLPIAGETFRGRRHAGV